MNYESLSLVLKSLADPNHMKIIDLLSCGSLCKCYLLEIFNQFNLWLRFQNICDIICLGQLNMLSRCYLLFIPC